MSNSIKNQPLIRFNGFEDDWIQRKLGEVAKRVKDNDGRMNIPTLTISASLGWLDQRERFSGNIAGKEQNSYTLLKKGELSYNHGNSKLAKYGVVFVLREYDEALVPRIYHSFKVNDESYPYYIEYLFATKIPDRELSKLITSGARMDGLLNISYNDFMNIKINLPTLPEQSKIGNLFKTLDETIILHKRKSSELSQLKSTLLSKLFPKNGESVPEIRFTNFEANWEQRKLKQVVSYESSNYSTMQFKDIVYDGNYPVFDANNEIARIDSFDQKQDYISIIKDGAGAGRVMIRQAESSVISTMGYIKPQNSNINFIYSILGRFDLKQFVTGTTIPHIYFKDYGTINIYVPNLEEQSKIGNLFKTLDETITLHQTSYNELETLKKSLLNKLFV